MEYTTEQRFNPNACDTQDEIFFYRVMAMKLINMMSLEDLEKLIALQKLDPANPNTSYPGYSQELVDNLEMFCAIEFTATIDLDKCT